MIDLYFILGISSFALALFLIAIFARFAGRSNRSNYLLGASLFCIAYLSLINGLISSKLITSVPHLYRTASPLIYLIGPTAFLYTRNVLRDRTLDLKYDWIHFVPFIFNLVELMPFYTMGYAEKLQIVEALVGNTELSITFNEGILPPYVHFILKIALGLGYCVFQRREILLYKKDHPKPDRRERTLLQWNSRINAFYIAIYLVIVAGSLVQLPGLGRHEMVDIAISAGIILILVNLLLRPQILYGFSHYVQSQNLLEELKNPVVKPSGVDQAQQESVHSAIEDYLSTNVNYLRSDFRLQQMAGDLGVSRTVLSAVINSSYNVNFNTLINRRRIRYVVENIDQSDWQQLTWEGIAQSAGFNSRTTFINAFKAETGLTPSQFKRELANRSQA